MSVYDSSVRWLPAKTATLPKPVAPYDSDPAKAADKCFDRDTGIVIATSVLKTYKDALAQYHLRPEHKFLNGNHADRGITRRRHVRAVAVRYIGKESNRWEEQYYLGSDDGADIRYRLNLPEPKPLLVWVCARISEIGQRKVARETGVARRTIERLMKGIQVRDGVVAKICRFLDSR
jgi:DNA-binding Xre family transcriptional regulator